MARRPMRRDGFDYYIDRFEDTYRTYEDDYYDDYEDYRRGYEEDRFARRNRYTGEISGRPHYNTTSIYAGQRPRNQGTLEFTAAPGQGGLDPNMRPLGDETMFFSTPANTQVSAMSANPYVRQILENQQIQSNQQAELMKKVNDLEDGLKKTNELITQQFTSDLYFKDETVTNTNAIPQQPQPQPVAQPVAPAAPAPVVNVIAPAAPAPAPAPVVRPVVRTQTTQVQQPKKKKLSGKMMVICSILVLVAIALIVLGVLMIVGVINF